MERLLVQLSQTVDSARSVEGLARPLLAMLQATTGLESAYLTAIEDGGTRQRVLFAFNAGGLHIDEGRVLAWSDSLCRRALEEHRPHVDDVPDRWGESRFARELGLRTHASAAVRGVDGSVYGTLCASSTGRHVLDRDAEHALRLFAALIGQRMERERLLARLADADGELAGSALADPLTGLPNQRALELELARMLARVQRDDRALLVASIGLGDGSAVRDRHGDAAFERFVLGRVRQLDEALRGGDLVARVAASRLMVAGALPRENAEAAAEVLRDRLAAAMRVPVDLGGGLVLDPQDSSVGVALARSGEIDTGALLARAERAMLDASGDAGAA